MRERSNNVGIVRLLLACAVIIGHAPEMIDGNATREPVTAIFGHGTLGGLAVAGFFLLSGYLITASMMKVARVSPYLQRRVLRIVPGYLVAYSTSLLLLGALMHLDFMPYAREIVSNLLFLHEPPIMLNEIAQPYHTVNGALWTISFEFRCYLLICLLWMTGLLQNRRLMLWITLLMVGLAFLATSGSISGRIDELRAHRAFDLVIGTPSAGIHFIAIFLIGTCIYLFREALMPRLDAKAATFGLLAMCVSLTIPHLAEIGTFLFGAIPLFWLAFVANIGPLQRINDRWDISYGTYLYGWPVATAFIFLDRSIEPWQLVALTLPCTLVLGTASWWLVEKWTKDLARPHRPAMPTSAVP